jgi:hypothetical protein
LAISTPAILLASLMGIAALPAVGADGDGKADGQIVVAGKPVKLAHAYAFAQPGFFDKKASDTRVILTDVPLSGKALTDDFTRIGLAKQGKLHCLEVTIDAKRQPISVSIRHPALKAPLSGGSTEDAFEAKVFDGKVVEGRVFRKSPGQSFEDLEYTYDATFAATIAPGGK